jgi:hypothetical protein
MLSSSPVIFVSWAAHYKRHQHLHLPQGIPTAGQLSKIVAPTPTRTTN